MSGRIRSQLQCQEHGRTQRIAKMSRSHKGKHCASPVHRFRQESKEVHGTANVSQEIDEPFMDPLSMEASQKSYNSLKDMQQTALEVKAQWANKKPNVVALSGDNGEEEWEAVDTV